MARPYARWLLLLLLAMASAFACQQHTYLVYVAQGRLLRTGDESREPPVISWQEEMRILRATLSR